MASEYPDNKYDGLFSGDTNKEPPQTGAQAIHGNPIDAENPKPTGFALGASHPAPHG